MEEPFFALTADAQDAADAKGSARASVLLMPTAAAPSAATMQRTSGQPPMPCFDAAVAEGKGGKLVVQASPGPDTGFEMYYTSGTTGRPKVRSRHSAHFPPTHLFVHHAS